MKQKSKKNTDPWEGPGLTEKQKQVLKLQYWFATHKTEFDVSAIGFFNFMRKYHAHLL